MGGNTGEIQIGSSVLSDLVSKNEEMKNPPASVCA